MDTQTHESIADCLEYIEDLEKVYGLCMELIDSLVDMVYLAAADEEFLTPEVSEWLDALQEQSQTVVERLAAAVAGD